MADPLPWNPELSDDHHTVFERTYLKKQIAAAVDANFQPCTFRSSVALKNALKAIVESHLVPHLKYRYAQASLNKRVGALMKLSVSFLCMPRLSTLLGFGLVPSPNEGYEMTKRLKCCVTELLLILIEAERSKSTDASDAHLDVRRIDLLADMVLLRRSVLIPFVITMTENCPEALTHMSCNILVVNALADDILETIGIITERVRSLLNKDLSLTSTSTREILKAEFSRYFTWLRLHQDGLIKICRNNEIFCCVDKSVKAWLKGEEYESSAQILDRYNQKYRKYLTNMNIPLQAFRIEDVRQAVKDIKRDTIMLNNIRYCPHGGVSSRSRANQGNKNKEMMVDDREYHDYHRKKTKSCDSANGNKDCIDDTIPDETSNIIPLYEDNMNENNAQETDGEDSEKINLVHAIVNELYKSLYPQSHQNSKFSVITNTDNSFSVKRLSYEIKKTKAHEKNEKNIVRNANERLSEMNKLRSNRHEDEKKNLKMNDVSERSNISGLEFDEDNDKSKIDKDKCDDSIGDNPSVSTFSFIELNRGSADSFEEISGANGDDHTLSPSSDTKSRVPPKFNCNCSTGRSVSTLASTGNNSIKSSTTAAHTSYTFSTDVLEGAVPLCCYGKVDSITSNNQTSNSSVKLHENILEMLLNQVLLAASRTTAGGDAYIILENLYGGEGLLFSPKSYNTHHKKSNYASETDEGKGIFWRAESRIKQNQVTDNSVIHDYDYYPDNQGIAFAMISNYSIRHDDINERKNPTYREREREKESEEIRDVKTVENSSGIDISISKFGIRVVLKEQYNLLLKESLEQNMELSLPLISFECTTTTNITFGSVDITDKDRDKDSNCTCAYDLYHKLLYNTENICQRTITIEPIIFK